MAGPGVNLATTKDGGTYNKLQRPQDYLMSAITAPPPKKLPIADTTSSTSAGKRKREHANLTSKHKRTRMEHDSTSKERTRVIDCGMRTILPGLDDEEHSSDDSIGEALAYLRNVRSEASAIPHLLVGNTTRSHDDDESEQQVLFREGTCIALDDNYIAPSCDQDSDEDTGVPEPQDRLYELLLKRFHNLRATLTTTDEEEPVYTKRKGSAPTDRAYLLLRNERAWSDMVGRKYPDPSQVVRLDRATIYGGLQCCASSMDQAESISPQVSCWIWTLLALVGDVGTLDNEKISRIRDLAQKAGLLGVKLRKSSYGSLDMEEDISVGKQKGAGTNTSADLEENICENSFQEGAGVLGNAHGAKEHSHTHVNGGTDESEVLLPSAIPSADETNTHADPFDISESDAEMSMSGDENQVQHGVEESDLDQARARARLLTQLGDRLVHAQPLPSASFPDIVKENHIGQHDTQHDIEEQHQGPWEQQSKAGALQDGPEYHGVDSVSSGEVGEVMEYKADLNTQVTIDMILTVVAEYFGQRDLLRYRQRW